MLHVCNQVLTCLTVGAGVLVLAGAGVAAHQIVAPATVLTGLAHALVDLWNKYGICWTHSYRHCINRLLGRNGKSCDHEHTKCIAQFHCYYQVTIYDL